MRHLPRGTVTLLFTDIEGSTRLLQQLGEHYERVLAESRRLLRSIFDQWHGDVVDTQGDAFFVAFARANEAISAAVDAQRAFATHLFPAGVTVRIRMGIHTGEPALSSEGYIGLDVHRAARIMSAAHGGQVLLSQTTRDLVAHDPPEGVTLRHLGTHRLKDIDEQEQLFQLVIAGLPADFPPIKTISMHNRVHAFPSQPTSFIGRTHEIALVCDLLRREDVCLLTLTGTAGVGKTRLALQGAAHCADLFADGVYFVALAQVQEVDAVLPAIAQTLGVRQEQGQPLLERLKHALQEKHLLLVLDNVEQVMACTLVLVDLLKCSPLLKLLVTSREVLHVQAEHVLEVLPFAVPDPTHLPDLATLTHSPAMTLFLQRAQAVKPNFELTATNASAVASICASLDGLPLAIELAAARIKYAPVQVVLKQLEQGLGALKGGARDRPARQQTMRDAIAWSYELLDRQQQQLFRRLAVFVNGCTPHAVESVCYSASDQKGDVLEALEALVDKSLLRQEEQAEETPRFLMLQTLREYAGERLLSAGEVETTQQAHAMYYLARTQEMVPKLAGAEEAYWLDQLEREHENLRAALEWLVERARREAAYAEQAVRLCRALVEFWEIRGYFQEAHTFLERVLAASQAAAPAIRAQACYLLAAFRMMAQDDTEGSEALLEESLTLFRTLADKAGMADALRLLGQLRARKTTAEARSLLERALVLYEELADQQGIAFTRDDLARVATSQGDYARAGALLEQNLAFYRTREATYNKAYSLYLLARVLFLSQRDQQQAQTLAQESLSLFRAVGNKRFTATVLSLCGRMLLLQGGGEQARHQCEESVRLFRQGKNRIGLAEALMSLAQVMADREEVTAAQNCYKESWVILREGDAKELCATCLEGAGELMVGQGMPQRAAQLWGTAATLRAALVAPMPPVYRAAYEQAMAAAREQLGEEAFQAACAEGRTMSLQQIVL